MPPRWFRHRSRGTPVRNGARSLLSHRQRPPRSANRVRLGEWLEPRLPLAANIHLVEAYLSQSDGTRVAEPLEHVEYWLTARYSTADLPSDASYAVRFELADKVYTATDLIWGAGQTSAMATTLRGPFQVPRAGHYEAEVTLDSSNAIFESNETDNETEFSIQAARAAPPSEKFRLPLAGTPNVDWSILNYVDQDSDSGHAVDYHGGVYVYDGHDAIDFMLANFAEMDRGVDVMAAAGGVVVGVGDGEFDRQTTRSDAPANYVWIDHGDGWRTLYAHLRSGSVAVAVGQTVVAGQQLGLVGSSGSSTDAHLHFGVSHYDLPVETYEDPSRFWLPEAIVPYAGDTPGALDWGITDASISVSLMKERPPEREVFAPRSGETARFWARLHGIADDDLLRVVWLGPNGQPVGSTQTITGKAILYGHWAASRGFNSASPLGTWQAVFSINGQERARKAFQVNSAPTPRVRVDQDAIYVLDGRTTPLEFPTGTAGAPPPTKTFTITNHGTGPLNVSGLTLPEGFVALAAPPATIAPGSSATMLIGLDTSQPRDRMGSLVLFTDDAVEGEFKFVLQGKVIQAAPRVVNLKLAPKGNFSEPSKRALDPGAAGSVTIPFTSVEQLAVEFDQPVRAQQGALLVTRLDEPQGRVDSVDFLYDATHRTARWQLAAPLAAGRYQVRLVAGTDVNQIANLDNTALDGEAPVGGMFPSGDGSPGGDFTWELVVVPGDANGDGTVAVGDYVQWAAAFGKSGSALRTDFDWNGTVGLADYAIWAARLADSSSSFESLPSPVVAEAAPTAARFAPAATGNAAASANRAFPPGKNAGANFGVPTGSGWPSLRALVRAWHRAVFER